MNVALISIILTSLIFTALSFGYEGVKRINLSKTEEQVKKNQQLEDEQIDEKIKEEQLEEMYEENIWQVEIPSIDLVAPISEGTSQEVMREFVGHFENTNIWNGNIGLAAHNRRISNKLF